MNVDVNKYLQSLAAEEVVKLLQSDSGKGLSTKESQERLTYLPLANQLFYTAPISLIDWWMILGTSAITSMVIGVEKWVWHTLLKPG